MRMVELQRPAFETESSEYQPRDLMHGRLVVDDQHVPRFKRGRFSRKIEELFALYHRLPSSAICSRSYS